MDNRVNNGNKGHSTKSTRSDDGRLASKTKRQAVYELLNPYTDLAIQKHSEAIGTGERWAIELFYKYQFYHVLQDFHLQVHLFYLFQ